MKLYEAGPENRTAAAVWSTFEDIMCTMRAALEGDFHLAHICSSNAKRAYFDALRSLVEQEIATERAAVMAAKPENAP